MPGFELGRMRLAARRPAFTAIEFPVVISIADEPPGLTKQAVAFDDVPADVREAARKAVPEVTLNDA
jgi:hypothetical protein